MHLTAFVHHQLPQTLSTRTFSSCFCSSASLGSVLQKDFVRLSNSKNDQCSPVSFRSLYLTFLAAGIVLIARHGSVVCDVCVFCEKVLIYMWSL